MDQEDLLITQVDGSVYEVARAGGEVIGRTGSEQEALVLACSERLHGHVWLLEPSGRRVRVDCPTNSPLEQFGQQ
jgi:hypothetical protein